MPAGLKTALRRRFLPNPQMIRQGWEPLARHTLEHCGATAYNKHLNAKGSREEKHFWNFPTHASWYLNRVTKVSLNATFIVPRLITGVMNGTCRRKASSHLNPFLGSRSGWFTMPRAKGLKISQHPTALAAKLNLMPRSCVSRIMNCSTLPPCRWR